MKLRFSLFILLTFGLACTMAAYAQDRSQKRHRRAKSPEFKSEDVSRVFFDDVFARLVGERPARKARVDVDGAGPSSVAAGAGGEDAASASGGWSRIISSASIEDEIKSLKLSVDKTVTTPSAFAGRGHSTARLDFTLLAILFGIVEKYDGDVRWKESAPLAREQFARTASNLKAGGSIQVYNESKKRKQDLDDLVRGSRLQGTANDEMEWETIADRAPLMEMLDARFEPNVKAWTASDGDFQANQEELVREAELAAVIGAVLLSDGMDDADDDEYRGYAELLKAGGLELAQAARAKEAEAARKAVVTISRSCVDCHDVYR